MRLAAAAGGGGARAAGVLIATAALALAGCDDTEGPVDARPPDASDASAAVDAAGGDAAPGDAAVARDMACDGCTPPISFVLASEFKIDGGVAPEPASVTAGDLDGDGNLDIVVTAAAQKEFYMFRGSGQATFTYEDRLGPAATYAELILADLNRDKKLDILCTAPSSGGTTVFQGFGNWGFSSPTTYPPGGPEAVVDLDSDGNPDVVIRGSGPTQLGFLFGNGNATLRGVVNHDVGFEWSSIAAADFNGDGNIDLAINHWKQPAFSILLGRGGAQFQVPVDYAVAEDPWDVFAADLNGDGSPDLVIGTSANAGTTTVRIFQGLGDGTLQPGAIYPVAHRDVQLIADLDRDGPPDIVLLGTDGPDSDAPVRVATLRGRGDGTFFPLLEVGPVRSWYSRKWVAGGDFDGDGRLDLAVGHRTGVAVLRNTSP